MLLVRSFAVFHDERVSLCPPPLFWLSVHGIVHAFPGTRRSSHHTDLALFLWRSKNVVAFAIPAYTYTNFQAFGEALTEIGPGGARSGAFFRRCAFPSDGAANCAVGMPAVA